MPQETKLVPVDPSINEIDSTDFGNSVTMSKNKDASSAIIGSISKSGKDLSFAVVSTQ